MGHSIDIYKNYIVIYGGEEKSLDKIKNMSNDIKIIDTSIITYIL